MTGAGLMAQLEAASEIVDDLAATLQVPTDKLCERVAQLLEDNRKLAKELKTASKTGGPDTMAEARGLLDAGEKVGEASIVVGPLTPTSIERAREAVDMLKKKAGSAAVVVGFDDDGKAVLLAGVTDDLVKKGLKAGDVIKKIAPIVGGGGGGRPQMAQAGGKDPAKINEALAKAKEIVSATLGA